MTTTNLTDLGIQRLPFQSRQRIFWDETVPAFGLRVGIRSKTFVVKRGNTLVTLGRYPDLALREARRLAMGEKARKVDSASIDAPGAVLAFLGASQSRVERQTYDQYDHYLNFFNLRGKIQDITRTAVRRRLDELEGKPTAQNMAFFSLRNFLNWCVKNDLIDRSPIHGMTPPNKLQSRDRVLSDDELKAIWNATEGGENGILKFNRMVRILMLTGQRRSEIAGLVQENVSDLLTFPDTKNDQVHSIPVTPLVEEHLVLPFTFNDWNRCKERLDKVSGVTGWVIHDLRRTFATNCARIGVPIHLVEKILNHKSATFSGIVRVYQRYSFLDEMRAALLQHENFIKKTCDIRPKLHIVPDERYMRRLTTVLKTGESITA